MENTNVGLKNDELVLPFNSDTSLFEAQVIKSTASGLTKYYNFLKELGEKTAVDTLVNEALRKGLSQAVRYQATVIKNNVGKKVMEMAGNKVDSESIERYVNFNNEIFKSLLNLADDIIKGTA
jgi:hypothetical protein